MREIYACKIFKPKGGKTRGRGPGENAYASGDVGAKQATAEPEGGGPRAKAILRQEREAITKLSNRLRGREGGPGRLGGSKRHIQLRGGRSSRLGDIGAKT